MSERKHRNSSKDDKLSQSVLAAKWCYTIQRVLQLGVCDLEWRPGRREGKDVSEAEEVFFLVKGKIHREKKLSHC